MSPITPNELRFLADLARIAQSESLRALLLDDLFYRARAAGASGLEYIIRACAISEESVRSADAEWSAIDRALSQAYRRTVDVLLVAVKKPEVAALRHAFDLWNSVPTAGPSGSRFWEFSLPRSERNSLTLAVTYVGDSQNYKMSSFLHVVLEQYRPRFCILVGMAAGRVREVRKGDVVIATEVVDYACVRLTQDGAIPEPSFYTCDLEFTRPFSSLSPSFIGDWHSETRERLARAASLENSDVLLPRELRLTASKFSPSLYTGVILAGDLLLEDGSLSVHAVDLKRKKTLAAEMEGAGFAYFLKEVGLRWMIVRGIADFGDKNRKKDWQFASSLAAAQLVKLMLASGQLGPPKSD